MNGTIGFIGLGNMGSGMADNLRHDGYDVACYDTDAQKLKNHTAATSISELTNTCEVIILCLPHPNASLEVVDAIIALRNKVRIIIETSTLTPEIVGSIADKVTDAGIEFLSAPMIGGRNHAVDGTIEFVVEGDETLLENHINIFNAMGKKAQFMGKIPSATLAKMAFNLSRYANIATAINIYRLMKPFNPDMQAIHRFLSEQSLDNFGQVWPEDMLSTYSADELYRPSNIPKKDLALFIEIAKSSEIDPALIEAVRQTYLSLE